MKKAFLTAVIFCLVISVFAQQDNNQLQVISKEMMVNGNANFIIVQAIADGFMKLDAPYEFGYTDRVFRINDKKLPKDVQKRYNELMDRFYMTYNKNSASQGKAHSKGDSFISKGEGISMEQILDEHSFLRRTENRDIRAQIKEQRKFSDRIVQELMNDGFVSAGEDVNFKYGKDGFFINEQKIEGSLEKKYADFFVQLTASNPLEGHTSGSIQTTAK